MQHWYWKTVPLSTSNKTPAGTENNTTLRSKYSARPANYVFSKKVFSLLLEMQEIRLRGSLKRSFSKAPGKLFFLTQKVSRKITVNVFMRFS